MKLSIITINYNNLQGLEKTYQSVVSQTWQDFEWIIIDGGSTDGSMELIEKKSAICKNISYWCSESDRGVYHAQNKGIAKSQGEYLCFLNSGDIFHDEFVLEKVFDYKISADIIYGDWYWCDESSRWMASCPHKITIATLYNSNICHQAMFIRGKMLRERGYDETYKIYADWARWMELVCDGHTFQYVPVVVCDFMLGGLSGMDSSRMKLEADRVRSIPPKCVQDVLADYNSMCDFCYSIKRDWDINTAIRLIQRYAIVREIFHWETVVLRRIIKVVRGIARKFAFR